MAGTALGIMGAWVERLGPPARPVIIQGLGR
jgi:hypothetical protein